MRPRSALAGLTAAGLVLLPLAAEAARPKAKAPPTVEQIAAARARGDAMIAATGAPDLFLNVTEDDTPRVLHRPSRLLCYFDQDAAGGRIEIGAGEHREDTVACITGGGDVTRRLSASRAGGTGAAEDRAQATVAALRSAHPGAGPVGKAGAPLVWKLKLALPAYTFQATNGGGFVTTNVSAIDAREWAVTHETTSVGKDARVTALVAQTLNEIYLTLTLYEMSGVTRNGDPVPQGQL